jgi:hypothetical protein
MKYKGKVLKIKNDKYYVDGKEINIDGKKIIEAFQQHVDNVSKSTKPKKVKFGPITPNANYELEFEQEEE